MHQISSCTVSDNTEQRAGERSPVIVQLPNNHLSPSASSPSVVVSIQGYYKHLKHVNELAFTGGRKLSSNCGFEKSNS